MIAELISVGTELLMGNILNTNVRYLAEQCASLGISVYHQITVGDNEERLQKTIETALERSDIIILSGGLGPTEDDLTKEMVARAISRTLVEDTNTKERIKAYFKGSIYTEIPENNWKQAAVIKDSIILDNDNGTAPGMIVEWQERILILLPGPPGELIPLFEKKVRPYLEKKQDRVFLSSMVKLCGIGESQVEFQIKDLIDRQKNPTIATYAKPGEVWIRVTASGKDNKQANMVLEPILKEIRERLQAYIFTEKESETLEEYLINMIKKKHISIATAESCTGGMIASRLIHVPGASEVFREGYITYADESKVRILGVSKETIKTDGVVSEGVVRQMASGAATNAHADLAISVSGIAGPGGGTEKKPVGLVYIGCYYNGMTAAKSYQFRGDREKIRAYATQYALIMIRDALTGELFSA